MLVMVGQQPVWCCDICHHGVAQGVVLYSQASSRNHYPAPLVCCGESCAIIGDARLEVKPVRPMSWQDFVKALT